MTSTIAPKTPFETVTAWGHENLETVVAIDSSSDETSSSIPSSEGQRKLSAHLEKMFRAQGFSTESDAFANLIVKIAATKGKEKAPPIALMVHVDTAHGTSAIPKLHVVSKWSGAKVAYPKNERLHVDVDAYPLLRAFVGDDVLHGNGDFPFGLDDKLGMSEIMTLAKLLHAEPDIPHGDVYLVFRPDEEIGRMEAVKGLAKTLAQKGVKLGYTVDGLSPFEVNVENFDAARVRVKIPSTALGARDALKKRARIHVTGVNTHGATAKSEGYLNATTVFARAMKTLGNDANALSFQSDNLLECNAVVDVACADIAKVRAAFEAVVAPAAKRGAGVRVDEIDAHGSVDDGAEKLRALLTRFLDDENAPKPLLSEESDGYEGYTNAHRAVKHGDEIVVDFRLRDFSKPALAKRAAHVAHCAAECGLMFVVEEQYVNMGPTLSQHPELVRYVEEAAKSAGVTPEQRPIRGGTGVDPFLVEGIPVANVGTGYFAPESEKELTSRQNIARHTLWLAHLVQVIAMNGVK